jgi:hypothetical protein
MTNKSFEELEEEINNFPEWFIHEFLKKLINKINYENKEMLDEKL